MGKKACSGRAGCGRQRHNLSAAALDGDTFSRILRDLRAILLKLASAFTRVGCLLSTAFSVKERQPKTGGGGRGPIDYRDHGGGGGGGRGDNVPNYRERLRRYRLGMAIALVAVVMLFVSSTMVFLLRARVGTWNSAAGTYVQDWQPAPLPFRLLILNTVLLVISSISLEVSRREAAERALLAPLSSIPGIATGPPRSIPWLGISTGLGIAFLAGQLLAWRTL
jgi:cytochrome c oxidase subunit 3